ncbi:hypothetical protein RAS1_09070 [Phycisphaerae bacterium RAS1]|nr:hypothetical protein RAS1_09070 [Phycisphaerae bacterium RAS1]
MFRNISYIAFAVLLSSCSSPQNSHRHEMVAPADARPLNCQRCYDEVVRVRKHYVQGTKARRIGKRYVEITRHACPECRGDAIIYEQNEQLMLKCRECAPEGVACDRCLPPTSTD